MQDATWGRWAPIHTTHTAPVNSQYVVGCHAYVGMMIANAGRFPIFVYYSILRTDGHFFFVFLR